MFGKIGLPELALILAIALIIFGPRKLPEIGRAVGKGIREFRQATQEVKKSVSIDEDEEEKERKESVKGSEEGRKAKEEEAKEEKTLPEADSNKHQEA